MMLFHKETPGFARLVHNKALDIFNKYMVVHTWWEDTPVFFHNVYAPVQNQEREAFFDALPRDFPVNAQHIIMGDFNLPLQRELDAMDPFLMSSHWPIPMLSMARGLACRGCLASTQSISPDLMRTAYHQSAYFRSPEIVEHMCHRVILQPVSQPKRRAYWKLPKELLQVPEVVETIVAEAKQLLPVLRQANNPGVVWAGWKKRAKKFFQEYHVEHLLAKTRVSDLAKRELLRAQAAFDAGRLPPQALEQAQAKYDEMMSEWKSYQNDINFDFHATKNETSTAHFFRPPKKVLYNVPILEVQDADGTVSTCPQVIHDVFHAKWSAVMCENDFQAPNRASRRRFLRLLQKRLTDEQRDSLDSPITTYELAQAIKTMAPHKSPGMDGFPTAFYQLEADLFAEILCLVFKYQLSRGELLGIQRRSAVSLLFKGGDRSNPGNYRPIALIPVEVKILTRALAYRLRDLLPALIHPIQTGFVAGRRIHDHIIFLKDLQHKCTSGRHRRIRYVSGL
ncbi:hypothetical protein Ae201684P_015605 [Aphanomyces euteiches]|nr:hypothetical protein Ae201684P_017302 [Aphanomyces euteiches]KAH9072524.1 hypothetical protein Ae201684P_022101 [Aphanomyces euteiches]KAH9079085.1 hypothetical protein Ae201684P_015605 [Aphanomyces euteiches]